MVFPSLICPEFLKVQQSYRKKCLKIFSKFFRRALTIIFTKYFVITCSSRRSDWLSAEEFGKRNVFHEFHKKVHSKFAWQTTIVWCNSSLPSPLIKSKIFRYEIHFSQVDWLNLKGRQRWRCKSRTRDEKVEQLILFQCFTCQLLYVTLQSRCHIQRSQTMTRLNQWEMPKSWLP